MATHGTVLCIHHDPAQLSLLQENGYELVTASNGQEGLRLFMTRPVDAIVIERSLGLSDGAVIADAIKHVRPTVPIVMLADHLEFPDGALKSVDAVVTTSDGAHFLLATVHFMVHVKPAQRPVRKFTAQAPRYLLDPGGLRETAPHSLHPGPPAPDAMDAPFSPSLWQSIWDGSIQF